MKRFRYFFIIYSFVIIVWTRFFYVFSSEEIQAFVYDLSWESQNLEPDINLDSKLNLDISKTLEQEINLIQSWDTTQTSWEIINLDQTWTLNSEQTFPTPQPLDPEQNIPNLKITEVFRDWTDERIEITNFGTQTFSWTITINWVKSSEIIIPNFTISPNQSLILWDDCFMISDFSSIWVTWLAMSISDTSPIYISISYSWQQIDSFLINENIVNNYNNRDTSFEKLILNSEFTITWTSIDRSYNVNSWYIANPGIVQTLTTSWTSITWVLTWISDLPKLSITEVFYDWTDEWIEITNFGTSWFVGNLKIYWATASPFDINNISIPSDRSVVIADTNNQFQDSSNVIIHTLSISDTSPISISLFYSWQKLDLFYIPQDFVNSINNFKTSFERVLNSWNLITTITNTGRIYNLKSNYISFWYIANPWKVWETNENITNISSTWNWVILDLSWLIIPINCWDFSNNPFQITEIFPGNSQTSTYIELLWLSDFSGVVVFSGQWLSDNFDINLDIKSGERILITDGLQGILEEQKIIVKPSLELQYAWWWLVVYGQDGRVLDIIYFLNFGTWKSSYFDWKHASCARILDKYSHYSPGFDEILLSYFPAWVATYVDKIVYVGWWGVWSCTTTSINTGSNNNSWSIVSTWTTIDYSQIKIVSIDYDPEWSDTDRESVILQSLSSQDLDLNKYRLQVVGKDYKKTIRGEVLHSLSTETFIWNYQFPNTASCINLLQENIILDTYCYWTWVTIPTTNTWVNWTDIFSWTQNFTWNWDIEITSINYNPNGTDTNNESITLKLNWTSTINLSSFKLRINKDNKTTKKSISWILQPWQTQTFIWNYQFPNTTDDWKNIIVSLVYNDIYILDTYSYNPNIPTDLPAPWIYNVYSVIDGDTFKIKNWTKTTSIRLLWVDAPESSKTRFGYIECFWSQSKDYLKNLLYKKDIMLQYDDSQIVDSYGRALGYIFLDWQNINEKIVKDWYAREYTHLNKPYQYQSIFRSAQLYASQNLLWLRSSSACSWERKALWSWTVILSTTWVYTTWDANIKILSILPNPQWSDKWKEKITLIYNYSGLDIELTSQQSLDLSQWYYLLIWTRKKYLSWNLIDWEEKTLIWNYQFPNKASCISIAKDNLILDTFCYDKADNGEIFQKNNWVLSSISDIDLSILNSSKLQAFGSNLCLTYKWQVFHCKKMPSSKTSTKNQNKIKLYENYLNLIDDYLRQNRQVLFYNTDIKYYFNLLNEAKKNISNGIYYVNINWEYIQTTDIVQRYDLAYNQTSYDFILNSFRNNIVWMDIVDKYKKLKEEYFKTLAN